MHFVFDVDDTGAKTHPFYVKHFRENFDIELPKDVYATPENAGPHFYDFVNSGYFLDKVEMYEGFAEAIFQIKRDGHSASVCSHRGYHPMGMSKTRKLFGQELWNQFDNHYFLDPLRTPNKMDFLESVIEGPFVILDDRPHFSSELDPEDYNNIVLFDQPWNKHLPFPRIGKYDENFLPFLYAQAKRLTNF